MYIKIKNIKSPLESEMKRYGSVAMFLSVVFFLLFFSGSGAAETQITVPQHLTIQESIQIAVANNPAVTQAEAMVSASDERMIQARSGLYPQVNVSGTFNRTTSPMMAFGTKLNQGRISAEDFMPDRLNDPEAIDNYGLTFSAMWSLFDSGQTWYGLRQAEMGQTAAGLVLDRTIQEIIANTVSAYNGLLLSVQRLETVLQALKTAAANQKMVQSRFESGFVVKSDFLQTQVHIANLNQQRLRAESDVKVAQAELCTVMGVSADTPFEPADTLESGPETTGALDEWLDKAVANRPDLKALLKQEAISETEVKKASASRLPSISLSADYGTNSESFNDGDDSYSIGGTVNFNLFSGFRISAKVAEANAMLKQIKAGRSALEQRISVETRRAYFQAKSTWAQIQVADASMTQAEEALRIVRNRYESGLFTIVELLNTELVLHQARTGRLRAIHDYNDARVALMLATGTLDTSFR
jgi:outer membrane protein